MEMDFKMEGLDELEKQLATLEQVAQKRVLRKAVREPARLVEKEMMSRAQSQGHVDTGQLVDSIKTKTSFPKSSTWADAIGSAGVFKNRKLMDQSGKELDAPIYAWWLEFGTEPHSLAGKAKRGRGKGQDSGNQHPGIKPKPFIRPAFDAKMNEALNLQKKILAREIDLILSRT